MTSPHPPASKPVAVGAVIRDILKGCRTRGDTRMVRIWEVWPVAVGEAVAANAQPAAFKGALLLVHVNSSVWMQQLQFLKDDLRDQINQALGEPLVEDLKFKIGSLTGE